MKPHWVNRAYMEQWADPDRPLKDNLKDSPYVWKLDIETKNIKNRDPKNIANKPSNYYLLENNKGESVYFELEQKLAQEEGNFLRVIREKIEQKIPLKESDREVIALFMSLAIFRKPSYIDKLSGFVDEILNDLVLPHLAKEIKSKEYSEDELIKMQQDYLNETGNSISTKEILESAKNIDSNNMKASLSKNKKLSSIGFGKHINQWKNFIKNHNWLFLEGNSFITGDLSYFSIFPLTPKICIILMNNNLEQEWRILTPKEEKDLNKNILENCESFAISQHKIILENLL
jgi:hypothetical protein